MSFDGIIDAHVHVWTPDVASYPLAAGYATERMCPRGFTAEEFLSIAKIHGVCRAVLIQMDFYGNDNAYLLETLRRYPQIFTGVAQVDEFGPDPSGKMCDLRRLGVRGVRIVPATYGDPNAFDSPGMNSMWRCAAAERMAICPLIESVDLPALDRCCGRHPETTVVIDHGANIGGDGQFREGDINRLCELSRHENVYVKISAFYYLGQKSPPYDDVVPLIRRLIESFGTRRLMWGSDCPFQLDPPNSFLDSLTLVRDRLDFVSTEDREWLLQRTAAGVFFS